MHSLKDFLNINYSKEKPEIKIPQCDMIFDAVFSKYSELKKHAFPRSFTLFLKNKTEKDYDIKKKIKLEESIKNVDACEAVSWQKFKQTCVTFESKDVADDLDKLYDDILKLLNDDDVSSLKKRYTDSYSEYSLFRIISSRIFTIFLPRMKKLN
jgi:hypothetical protein